MMRVLLGSPQVKAITPDEALAPEGYPGLEFLQVGSLRIPVDDTASALVPYRGRRNSFRYYSIVDVINDRIDPSELKGKIVIVGTTAPGCSTCGRPRWMRSTPASRCMPTWSRACSTVYQQRPPYVVGAEFLLLLITGWCWRCCFHC